MDYGAPIGNMAGTGGDDGMQFTLSFLELLAQVPMEFQQLAPQPPVQFQQLAPQPPVQFEELAPQPPVRNVVKRKRGAESMEVAAAAAALESVSLAPQPWAQNGDVIRRMTTGVERMEVTTVEPAAVAVDQSVALAPQPWLQQNGDVIRRMTTGVERMELTTVEPAASGSKRQRTATGWTETTGGEDDEQMLEEVLEELMGNRGDQAPNKRQWTKEHDQTWWNEVSHPSFPAHEFKRLFHISPSIFDMVCGELQASVAKNDTALRQAVPVRKRVAVCLWRLASGEPLRMVAKRFGIGISTCHKMSIEVCAAIKDLLMPKFLLWPEDGATATAIAAEFEAACMIPNIVGAIHTTHVSIISPKINSMSYYNSRHTKRRKKPSYSVSLQAVVDAAGTFTDICVGYPGAMTDEQVLLQSSLSKPRSDTGELQTAGKWVVGGVSYPVKDWMLVPYVGGNLTLVQKMFNSKVTGAHKVAKDAAMRLKARWNMLLKRNEMNVRDLPNTLGACCVLHNICERYGDTLDPELAFDLDDDEMFPVQPVHSPAASLVRDNIASYIFLNGADGDVMTCL